MKKIMTTIGLIMSIVMISQAQNINWKSLVEDQKSIVNINFGYDFGVTSQIGYSRSINGLEPLLLTIDFSIPMGEDLFDDYKFRAGGIIKVIEFNRFTVSGKVLANYRSHKTSLVKTVGFGSEISIMTGYYKPTWYVSLELGFDKSIITYLEHSDLMKDNFDEITDGWFIPSGGHFYYGIQASKNLGISEELFLRAGATNAQGNDESAILPFYAQLGLSKKF